MKRSDDGDFRPLITRREAVLRVSAMLGGVALVGQGAMLAACDPKQARTTAPRDTLFAGSDVELLGEIAETILPETETPGARAAGVGPFIATMVVDTYDARERATFVDGLADLDARCREMHGADFLSAAPAQRLSLLERLDAEQFEEMRAREDADGSGDAPPAHYFRMLKELTLLGYFTSEIGYTRAMRYAETPGRFDPCVPYEPGGKAWAPHA